jgi:putative PEP-CTERM system histidine kinase
MNAVMILAYASAILSALMGLGAALGAKRSLPRWAFVAGMLALAVEGVFRGLTATEIAPSELFRWELRVLIASSFIPGPWLLFSLTYARGNARAFLKQWAWVVATVFLGPPLLAIIWQDDLVIAITPPQGDGSWFYRLGSPGVALNLSFLIAALLVLMNLERTFRASVGTARWRIKYMLMGVGLLFVVRIFITSQSLLFHGIIFSIESLNSATIIVAVLLMFRSLMRTRQSELDVYPSQYVLHSSATVFLVGLYLLIVGALAKVVTWLGGDATFSYKAMLVLVSLVVLAIFLQSDRVQFQLRRFISRNFQRPMYDYRSVWRKFTEDTASRVEQDEFCRVAVRLLADIFQTLSVTIWLADSHRHELTWAASTFLSEVRAKKLSPDTTETKLVLEHLLAHPEPIDFENITDNWAAILRHCHPDEFHKGGTRVCVPVIARGDVLALIVLGDRVGGAPFTFQDFDLLKSIGDHVASSLLSARLSQRLLQAREHEAFQTMATFFVHDLKNAAFTLNLMLQNLPTHFDDPAFREDALRGVAKTVSHINGLISRLGQLRHELKIQPVNSDLNEVISTTLAGLEQNAGIPIELSLGQIPSIPLDRDQFAKVVTNLVLNAREAMPGGGHIRLATGNSGVWVNLSVSDNGCGMSPDFVAKSLFRPFQTTKKSGIGIGMFQSKMIVEAHGGRISVESTPGQGTTFQISLPTTTQHSR